MDNNALHENKNTSISEKILFLPLFFSIAFLVIFFSKNFKTILSPQGKAMPSKVNVLDEIVKPELEKIPESYKLFEKKEGIIPSVEANEEIVPAASYILTDLDTGEILNSKNKDMRLPVASLTKIMTSIIALDLAESDDLFTVSENAANKIPTKIGAKVSEKLTVKELVEASLLTSANDAAQVIADGIDKKFGEDVFIPAMNEKAKFLGLSNSSFANPQGFDDGKNFSTVNDLAILTYYAVTNYPLISETVKNEKMVLPQDSNHHIFDLPNWNGLIGVYPDTIGMKIGNTDDAGKTTIVISNRGGKKLIAIVLGAQTILKRDLWAASLLDYGYKKTLGLPPINITEEQLGLKYQTWYE